MQGKGQHVRILLVEDDQPLADSTRRALQSRGWAVDINPASLPRIRVNQSYAGLIDRSADHAMLRTQLQEARWLIKSLETRADTLLRVAKAIVRQQSGFLEHGTQAMRPLTLREVAEELGLHESTISRATTRKYLRTKALWEVAASA